MKRHTDKTPKPASTGPSQRQLRAGELIRHALVDILRHEDLQDPALHNVSVTVTEVRLTPSWAAPKWWSRASTACPSSCADAWARPST